jgi:hypothetical protein
MDLDATERAVNEQVVGVIDDLDKWIDGTCGITRRATIYQRGDLFAEVDRLKQEHEDAGQIPAEQRGVADRTPDTILAEWETAATQLVESAMVVHVQDRTEERRRAIQDRLVKHDKLDPAKPDDDTTILLHKLADAIVKAELPGGAVKEFPDGFPPNKLREIKARLGDSGLYDALRAFREVTLTAPTVTVPLSQGSSSGRSGVT